MNNPTFSLPLAAALCGLAALQGAVAQTPLSLPNADFEAGTEGWRIKEDGPMTRAVAEAAYSGEQGLRIEDNDGTQGSSAVSGRLDVQPGKRYRVTFWGRTDTPGAVAVYAWFYKKAGGEFIKQQETPVATINRKGGWHTYTLEFEPPEEAGYLALWIHSLGTGTGAADVDDLVVEEL